MNTLTRSTPLILLAYALTAIGGDFDRAQVGREALQVLDQFMSSFNARDPQAHTATYHFPHYRLARGDMNVWTTREDAEQAHADLFRSLPDNGWDRSMWVQRRIVTLSETKVHVATRFRRLRKDGSEIGTYDSLYVLINKDGRWGVKMRSSFL